MLLLALAMITFWDSSFLPQGAQCGKWEDDVCSILEKDMLEQLTWMLASAGQVAFLVVWGLSRKRSTQLNEITFDASMDEDRARLRGMSDMIYLKQRATAELIGSDDWNTAIERYETSTQGREAMLVGLDMIRSTQAKMLLHVGLGRWDEAEEMAVDLLALQGGRDAQTARLVLCAASLAQRDYQEAVPRLALLNNNDVEAVRLRWVASLLTGKQHLDRDGTSMLSVDPLRRDNIRMLEAFESGEVNLRKNPVRQPAQRAMYLAEIARLRLMGRSEEALNHLERTMAQGDGSTWVHGRLVQALLNFDDGRSLTAINAVKQLALDHPRHPHVRGVLHELAAMGKARRPPSEPTNIQWAVENDTDWKDAWSLHNVAVPPVLDTNDLKQHAVRANVDPLADRRRPGETRREKTAKRLPDQVPLGLYTHMGGLIITIAGMPDLGLPAGIDLKTARKHGLLDT